MKHLRHLLPYLARYSRKLILGLLCVVMMSAIGLLSPLVVGRAVDSLHTDLSGDSLLRYAGLLLAIAAVQGLFSFGHRMVLVSMSRDVEYELRNDYLGHLQRLPQSFYHDNYTGDLMARATNDLEAVRMVCGPAIMYSANTLFTGVGCLLLMGKIHLWLTLIAVGTMPLTAVMTREFGQRIHHHFTRVQEGFSNLSTRVQENLAGARVVRAYAQEPQEETAFRHLNTEYVEQNRLLIRWTAAFQPFLRLIIGFGFIAVLAYGGLVTYLGEITVGDFVMFNMFLQKLIWPMVAIGWVINLVQRAAASLERIQRVLSMPVAIRDEEPLVQVDGLRGDIALRDLSFAYGPSSPPVLKDIDLAIPAGTTVAVVGRTGAGKSTLLSLIPRIIDPPPETLFIDGIDSRRLPLGTLRGHIGMVAQETFLFSATVRENIAFGRPEASDEEVLEAAHRAGLDEDLQQLPKGLDTVVGERGITLSGGQKQRVAIARALLREPRILLLDDCLSAVDTHTEERILGNLRQVFVGRTVLMVSHRISAVKDADLILVLEDGRITARGSHEELVAGGGLYADLHQRQQLEEQLAAV